MFRLADRIENGIDPMLKNLECYIIEQALDDMVQSSRIISTVSEGVLFLQLVGVFYFYC